MVHSLVSVNAGETFPDVSDLFSEVSKFQHHTELCYKCTISLYSFLNLFAVYNTATITNTYIKIRVKEDVRCILRK